MDKIGWQAEMIKIVIFIFEKMIPSEN